MDGNEKTCSQVAGNGRAFAQNKKAVAFARQGDPNAARRQQAVADPTGNDKCQVFFRKPVNG
jgi:hypothetical protein